MNELQRIYRRRFEEDLPFRRKMYAVLCRSFFQKYVPPDATVLEVAAGYCEFINSIRASRRIALDLNPDARRHAGPGVEVLTLPSTAMTQVPDESIDVAFVSNLFEHLTREDIGRTIREVRRVLKRNGRFLILQPNIRYCSKDYWMFFDHLTPLDDRSLAEALEINGFQVAECIPRFLPFTTKGSLPKSILLLRLYLLFPPARHLWGAQAFVYALKTPDAFQSPR